MNYYQRSKHCIANGALTNSKRPECFVKGIYPTHLRSGRSCFVTDEHGTHFIDYICGLGTNILGYDYFNNTNLKKYNFEGLCLSLPSTIEVRFAEELKEAFPFIDKLRILKTGSEACTASIRIARTFNRDKRLIMSNGYHGWHDEFVSLTPPSNGIPYKFSDIMQFSDIEQIERLKNIICAVIVEPVMTDYSNERRKFLHDLRSLCNREGIILIFDEIVTGYRFPEMSVSKYWGIYPDIILLGKAMGNGFPIAVVGGRKYIMDSDYFVSSTYAGERLSIEGARTVLHDFKTHNYASKIWEKGKSFLDKFNSIDPELIRIEGYPTRGVFKADDLTKALFFQECCKAKILFGSSWFYSLDHSSYEDQTITICKCVIQRIKNKEIKLEGEMPSSPFRSKSEEFMSLKKIVDELKTKKDEILVLQNELQKKVSEYKDFMRDKLGFCDTDKYDLVNLLDFLQKNVKDDSSN